MTQIHSTHVDSIEIFKLGLSVCVHVCMYACGVCTVKFNLLTYGKGTSACSACMWLLEHDKASNNTPKVQEMSCQLLSVVHGLANYIAI